jgi:hypothetical protein
MLTVRAAATQFASQARATSVSLNLLANTTRDWLELANDVGFTPIQNRLNYSSVFPTIYVFKNHLNSTSLFSYWSPAHETVFCIIRRQLHLIKCCLNIWAVIYGSPSGDEWSVNTLVMLG